MGSPVLSLLDLSVPDDDDDDIFLPQLLPIIKITVF